MKMPVECFEIPKMGYTCSNKHHVETMYKQNWELVNEDEMTAAVLQKDYLRWTSCLNGNPCGDRELYS
jgi:hypothetical protein